MNNRPEECLSTNIYYDSKVVGECCEKRDPQLSSLSYKRSMCDDELVDVTNCHGLCKQHACYLVERSTSGSTSGADRGRGRDQSTAALSSTRWGRPRCQEPRTPTSS
eukprot:scaffold7557_cov61-Phaeocystis_antarctica.AAC.2